MNIKQKSNEFRSIVNKMADLYEKKNSNYGDSFGQLYKELGPTAGLVPLWNKLHRATSLIKGDENHFESLEDTLKDLACYAIMNLIEMKVEQESKCHSRTEKYIDNENKANDIFSDVKEYNINEYKLTRGAGEPIKTFDRPGQTEEGWWDAITEKFIPWDDSINTNHTTDPCASCVIKPHADDITLVGDSPCQWCDKNPYKVTCNTATSINGTYTTYTLNNKKGETNNEK